MLELAIVVSVAMVCGTLLCLAKLFMPLARRNVEVRAGASTQAPVSVPNDLLLAASKWHDSWAREQALKSIQELYASTGSWDQVRFLFSQQISNENA
ncbi:MAG: hypothetical protein L0Z53_06840 [Acidobacteriales bacterium]|nr:hypothetical protein [Terriglobales bacterium]